jgi:multidrug resistance efflux pump
MKLLLLCCIPLLLFSKVHYAKVEPYESVILKSSVNGLVLDVDLDAEGRMIAFKRVIHLDDKLDKINLRDSKKSVDLLQKMLELNRNIAKSLNGTVRRQEEYYRRISRLSTASKTQKDTAYNNFSSAKTQYLTTREKMMSLEKQILDMQYKISQLEDSIDKKSIILRDKYLYSLLVRKGDFVAPGTPLAKVDDANKAKLVLYLEPDELDKIDQKIIYLDGKKTEYKVDKIWKVADEKYISSYRTEIYIPAPKDSFSKLMKVELRSE